MDLWAVRQSIYGLEAAAEMPRRFLFPFLVTLKDLGSPLEVVYPSAARSCPERDAIVRNVESVGLESKDQNCRIGVVSVLHQLSKDELSPIFVLSVSDG